MEKEPKYKGRGQNPNSKAALAKYRHKPLDREMQSHGGKKSAEVRREAKLAKEILSLALDEEVTNNKTGEKSDKRNLTFRNLATKMATGDLNAIKLGLQILGELDGSAVSVEVNVQEQKQLTLTEAKEVFKRLNEQI